MPRMSVQVTADHMRQLRGTPSKGLLELVKNALDADATKVEVVFMQTPIGAIDTIVVSDNGAGMTLPEVRQHFRPLGRSWKRRQAFVTAGGRTLFGQYGRGRFGAFALGQAVTWMSTTTLVDRGEPSTVIVRWLAGEEEFDADSDTDADAAVSSNGGSTGGPTTSSALRVPARETGTRVEVRNVVNSCERLRTPQVVRALTEHFADYLNRYPGVTITYDGRFLDPDDLLIDRTEIVVDTTRANAALHGQPGGIQDRREYSDTAKVEISEWEYNIAPTINLCDPDSWTRASVRARVATPGIAYTARVLWDGNPALGNVDLEDMDDATGELLRVVRRALRGHFRQRAEDARRALVGDWKLEGSYPYEGDPETHVDQAERDLFDVVAVTAAPTLTNTDKTGRAFALRLLKLALQTDASALRKVLEQVIGLGADELDDLTRLLERTPLTSMIAVHRTATDRIAFCAWLKSILTDEEWVRSLTERGGLQEMMEDNVWIFGDDWQTVVAERSLTAGVQGLRERGMAGSDEVIQTVLDPDGRRVRVDLLLTRTRKVSGRRQNLVVELKRPSETLRKKQLDQLDNYVQTVIGDPQFNDGRIDWTFVLVGRTTDEYVDRKRTAIDRTVGVVDKQREDNGATYETKVVTWSELIEDAESRLAFLAEHLPDFPSQRDLADLNELHATVSR